MSDTTPHEAFHYPYKSEFWDFVLDTNHLHEGVYRRECNGVICVATHDPKTDRMVYRTEKTI